MHARVYTTWNLKLPHAGTIIFALMCVGILYTCVHRQCFLKYENDHIIILQGDHRAFKWICTLCYRGFKELNYAEGHITNEAHMIKIEVSSREVIPMDYFVSSSYQTVSNCIRTH